MSRPPKVVVLGMMSKMPVAGVVWQTLHYLLGLDLLGVEAYYVESHARTPSMLMSRPGDDGAALAAGWIAAVMHRFGFDRRWAFHALHDDGRCFGMTHGELSRLYADAACIVNLHGGTEPLPEHSATGRLVYLETDPVQLQLELAEGRPSTVEFLDAHAAHFTFAENWGRPDCLLPASDRFAFTATRQPVVLDLWAAPAPPAGGGRFTTVANWDQRWRDVEFEGQVYRWNKRDEFLKLLALPARSPRRLELALAGCEGDDRSVLEANGWLVRTAEPLSSSIDAYRSYVRGSLGEFTVAKDQNVRLRSGWFSDRSATYLAAGRPVVTQDTGFGAVLPTGAGLFAFSTLDEAAAALERVAAYPASQSRAALQVARDWFRHDVVLPPVLASVGVAVARRPGAAVPVVTRDATLRGDVLPASLGLEPAGKHPLRLADATEAAVLAMAPPRAPADVEVAAPSASIVVVTRDAPVCTRLCLLSVLANTEDPAWELVVVDNGSQPDTLDWIEALAGADARVRLVRNGENLGFPAAANIGLAAARGDVRVLLNSDTIVTPGWLAALCRHLEDPAVGLVGPVTNEAPGVSRLRSAYKTYGQLLAFAASRPLGVPPRHADMLAMFCVALRADVFTRVGPLDEGFGPGLFEDDDYAERVRRAGLRLVCAEDAFVHHFGRGSFGALVASGAAGELFARNRARFEEKWGTTWTPPAGREDPDYARQAERVRAAILAVVPQGASVAVCSRGDASLLELPGCRARHFPAAPDGSWAGWYPADDAGALAQLDAVRQAGCDYVVFPADAGWWLERYPALGDRLARLGGPLGSGPDCHVFRLDRDPHDLPVPARAGATTVHEGEGEVP